MVYFTSKMSLQRTSYILFCNTSGYIATNVLKNVKGIELKNSYLVIDFFRYYITNKSKINITNKTQIP